jgi:hypothetical protein
MTTDPLTVQDKELIPKYFGKRLEDLTINEFKQVLKDLRAKYHPDNFEKFEDATVREMATERFQQIEQLAAKLDAYFKGELPALAPSPDEAVPHDARYAFDGMKIEVVTSDKDLKYQLFGSFYRWLRLGERFKIPGAEKAYIIMDEDHRGVRIGYSETIRMYLTFGPEDPIETIVDWLYRNILGKASYLIIHGKKVEVDAGAMLMAIRKPALLL